LYTSLIIVTSHYNGRKRVLQGRKAQKGLYKTVVFMYKKDEEVGSLFEEVGGSI